MAAAAASSKAAADVLAAETAEVMAISATGVAALRPGVATEVTPLHAWTRERQVFLALRQLTFFGQHALTKVRIVAFLLTLDPRWQAC